jgi:cytochrome d ubiquinol oxidase subunit I
MGLNATRSIDRTIPGINELVAVSATRIRDGLIAYDALKSLKTDRSNPQLRATIEAHAQNLGYAFLLKQIRPDVENATPADIAQAAWTTVPNVPVLFWSFRIMVGMGLWFILLFSTAFWLSARQHLGKYRLFLLAACCSLPLPWIAAELGWIVAEYGRQPWVIEGVLPTALGVSSVGAGSVLASLLGFFFFYSALLVADLYLLTKYIRLGPEEPETETARVAVLRAAAE